jgi:hypothetical protein
VPVLGPRLVDVVDSASRRIAATPVAQGVVLSARPGGVYRLSFTGGCQA